MGGPRVRVVDQGSWGEWIVACAAVVDNAVDGLEGGALNWLEQTDSMDGLTWDWVGAQERWWCGRRRA